MSQSGIRSATVAGFFSSLPSPGELLRRGDAATPEGRAAERRRLALMSSLTAALAKAISAGVILVSVPLTLHYLGPDRYGMWLTLGSFMGMLSFADLGVGNGLVNLVASAHGQDDRAAIRGLISSAYAVLTLIAATLAVIALCGYSYVPWPRLFNVQSDLAAQEAGPAVAAFLACFALGIPLGVVQKISRVCSKGFTRDFGSAAAVCFRFSFCSPP